MWTPLIPASFDPAHVAKHGASTPIGRSGQPNEVAPCYVFLGERTSFLHQRPGAASERRHGRRILTPARKPHQGRPCPR
jgi:hypothetical protein